MRPDRVLLAYIIFCCFVVWLSGFGPGYMLGQRHAKPQAAPVARVAIPDTTYMSFDMTRIPRSAVVSSARITFSDVKPGKVRTDSVDISGFACSIADTSYGRSTNSPSIESRVLILEAEVKRLKEAK